jgi:hypothetical protein
VQEIKIGDEFRFTPDAFIAEKSSTSGKYEIPRELNGRVVYIHPKRRFFTVEAELNGSKIRESFNIF